VIAVGALAFVAPILPDKLEAWRRFTQELLQSRRREYEESRRRLGITCELAWCTQTAQEELAIVYIEAQDPARVLAQLAASEIAFDRWFRHKWLELHGLDLTGRPPAPGELVFEWHHTRS
jgi:hypothetical protein